MRVRVYRNLRRGDYSVQDAATRRVIDHRTELSLTDARFVVSEAGRQRVLATRRKNVHAFIVGELDERTNSAPSYLYGDKLPGRRVRYNPTRDLTFVEDFSGTPIYAAARVHLTPGGVFYLRHR